MAPFSLDYTPSLLDQYMQLFCSSIRLQLLARALPSKLTWQLYSLVYSYTRIKAGSSQDQEVPDREPLIHVVASFETVVPKLQADCQGLCTRIGQVGLKHHAKCGCTYPGVVIGTLCALMLLIMQSRVGQLRVCKRAAPPYSDRF